MPRRDLLCAAALALLLTAGGCPSDAGPDRLAPGRHKITKSLRGYWKADNAQRGCKWTVETKNGDVINHGSWTLKNRSQAVILGTGNLGMYFRPNDKCGVWTK